MVMTEPLGHSWGTRKLWKVCASCKAPWKTRKGRYARPVTGTGSPTCTCTPARWTAS